jgi:hypothetical protein
MHDIGDLVTLRVAFVDADGADVDPTEVTLTLEAPDGTLSTPTVDQTAAGHYEATVTPDDSGVWRYRFLGTGAWQAAESGYFEVQPTGIGDDTGSAETKARNRIRRLCAADHEPILTDADVDDLVEMARRPDVNGVMPTEDGWIPTFDIFYAVSSGWDTKAANAAGDFRFEEDNQVFYREQVVAHCLAMAKRYNRRMVVVTDF